MTVTLDFERFQYFNSETNSLKNKNCTEIESATFPNKTALSGANIKTNGMGSTKWIHHKERSFVSDYFIFFENFVSVEGEL